MLRATPDFLKSIAKNTVMSAVSPQDTSEDCYLARLKLREVEAADERDYLLKVQNDRGSDQYGVSLRVKGEEGHTIGAGHGNGSV